MDVGLRALLYTKYQDILCLENINKGVLYYPKGVALREMAEKRGEVELELINVWRITTAPDWKRMNTPAARRGASMEFTDGNQTDIVQVKAIPVHLVYNVWFWTRDRDKLNHIAERYLFWQQDNPNLNLLYDESYPVELDLHFGELVDESTIEEKYAVGSMHVMRVPITVDGWAFVTDSVKTVHTIVLTVYDKDDLETEADYTEIIVEDSNQNVELEAVLRLFTRTYNLTE
jgi:hypothetical protein